MEEQLRIERLESHVWLQAPEGQQESIGGFFRRHGTHRGPLHEGGH